MEKNQQFFFSVAILAIAYANLLLFFQATLPVELTLKRLDECIYNKKKQNQANHCWNANLVLFPSLPPAAAAAAAAARSIRRLESLPLR